MIDFDALVIGPCMAAFGEPVRYSAAGAPAFDLIGVYDEAYLAQMPIEGLMAGDISNTKPALGVQLSAFPVGVYPAQDDVLMIVRTGQEFQVNAVEADGKGAAMLTLNTVALSTPL